MLMDRFFESYSWGKSKGNTCMGWGISLVTSNVCSDAFLDVILIN